MDLGRWPVSISNSWNDSKLFMGDECSELVRFQEQWIQYVFVGRVVIVEKSSVITSQVGRVS